MPNNTLITPLTGKITCKGVQSYKTFVVYISALCSILLDLMMAPFFVYFADLPGGIVAVITTSMLMVILWGYQTYFWNEFTSLRTSIAKWRILIWLYAFLFGAMILNAIFAVGFVTQMLTPAIIPGSPELGGVSPRAFIPPAEYRDAFWWFCAGAAAVFTIVNEPILIWVLARTFKSDNEIDFPETQNVRPIRDKRRGSQGNSIDPLLQVGNGAS
jgi:hypothetical protein